jgi:nucleotide-binding universal stress UspA family protein
MGRPTIGRRLAAIFGVPGQDEAPARRSGPEPAGRFTGVLVPIDGSPLAERAVPIGAAIARRARARLLPVRAAWANPLPRPMLAETERGVRDWLREQLEAVAERARAAGASVETRLVYGDAAAAIGEAVVAAGVDLIVMSSHGRTGLARWVFGSVAQDVVRRAGVPVLVVPAKWDAGAGVPTGHVLLPLDGSALAAEAVVPASALARALRCGVVLLRVVPPPPSRARGDDLRARLEEARSYLGALATRPPLAGVVARQIVEPGEPGPTIAGVAQEEGVGAIAMATHGRGAVAVYLVGSVAGSVLEQTSLPVMLVRPAAMRQSADRPELPAPPTAVRRADGGEAASGVAEGG